MAKTEAVSIQHETTSYPRLDFRRKTLHWKSLNGPWKFSSRRSEPSKEERTQLAQSAVPDSQIAQGEIKVPFVYQTQASGVHSRDAREWVRYERTVSNFLTNSELQQGYHTLLRFGAIDYEAHIYIGSGDNLVGTHRGGHVPFTIDLGSEGTDAEFSIIVEARDSPNDLTQPRGKQYWKPEPESIFYTPSSGIWQSVWLEAVPPARIGDNVDGTVLRSNDIESGILHMEITIIRPQTTERAWEPHSVEVEIRLGHAEGSKVRVNIPQSECAVTVDVPMWLSQEQYQRLSDTSPPTSDTSAWKCMDGKCLALWSPEHPLLYDVMIKLYNKDNQILDEVCTTTGMRSLSWDHEDNTFRLNGKPYFQALVLDQGYWEHSNITPPSAEALRLDIELAKKMGFNGCRKHQKVEDPMFLYWADRLGFLVWGEMANAFEFSETYVERFNSEWKEAVTRDRNHPCIVTWTPINESWGYDDLKGNKQQRDHIRSLYEITKELDPTRPVNDNCGWEHVCTDLTTFHEYADAPALGDICATMDGILSDKGGRPVFVPSTSEDKGSQHSPTAPIICTEFGGVNVAPAGGEASTERDWGYTTANDPADLLKRFEALVMAVVEGGICCGFVYTQLTDIEQEVNGLYTIDRKPKLEPEKVKIFIDEAKNRYFELLQQKTVNREQTRVSSD